MKTPINQIILRVLPFLAALLFVPTAAAIDKPTGTFSSSGAAGTGIFANPNLRGVLIRADWADLEPTQGSFTFSSIASEIANAQTNGVPWSLAVAGGGVGSPAWLTDPTGSGGLGAPYITYSFRGVPGYKLPLFWNSIVQDRLEILADALAAQYGSDDSLKLVYVTQMTANGIEGHLQGVNMTDLVNAGYTDSLWIQAAKDASTSFAEAFTDKAIAFEVHEVNGTATVPETIINDLWDEPALQHRVGAAMWWISGKTSYQPDLIDVLTDFPGDIYGQVIGKSGDGPWAASTAYALGIFRMPTNPPATDRYRYEVTTAGTSGSTEPNWPTTVNATVSDGSVVWTCRASRFEDGDYTTVFSQAMTIGMRYIEPWEWEFKYGANSANGEWDDVLADFNDWSDAAFAPTTVSFAPSADTYANQASASTTYGSATSLNVMDSANDRWAYLKFSVSGITGTVTSAKLRLKCSATQSGSTRAYGVSDTTWTEGALTWNNKPAMGAQVDSETNVAASQWIELDVTSLITGDGTFSIGVQATSSSLVQYYSSDRTGTADDPVLEIVFQ